MKRTLRVSILSLHHLHAGDQVFCVALCLCGAEGVLIVLSLNASAAFTCGTLSFVFLPELFILELPSWTTHCGEGGGGCLAAGSWQAT